MKHKLLIVIAAICSGLSLSAQVFWTEDFGTGCDQGNLASAYTGPNGAWTIVGTGTNDSHANTWYVSAMEAGNAIGACGTGCGGTNDRTLHLSNVFISAVGLAADQGASYLSGGLCSPPFNICATTNRRAESPVINCTGKTGITLNAGYMEGGDGANDDAMLMYSPDGGTTWTMLDNMAKTPLGSCTPQGMWTSYSISLPASANNNAFVKIGFQWTNNDDAVGDDPSFAIDDITLGTVATGIADQQILNPEVFVADNNVIIRCSETVKLEGVFDVLGRNVISTMENNTIGMNSQPAGVYFVRMEVRGKIHTKKVMIK